MQPLAIDLFCGLGGWTQGLLDAGYRVIGFDNERHVYGDERYPAQLVLQDVLTIHGRQCKDAALIVASPPCQAYSYRAMPWKRAKALPPPDNSLFEACFRIQREAIDAAGHFIPLVVENVRGAQPYVGRSKYHFGSFHLWGDVPALMPMTRGRVAFKGGDRNIGRASGEHIWNTSFADGATKLGGFSWSDFGKPGYKALAFNGEADKRLREEEHRQISKAWRDKHYDETEKMQIAGAGSDLNERGVTGFTPHGEPLGKNTLGRKHGSKSKSRKRASAMIAKIPLVLSRHIAQAWYPA